MTSRQHIAGGALAALLASLASVSAADDEPSPALSWNCAGCHGTDGASAGPMVPSIAGMDPRYFMHLMQDFKQGERYSTIMGRIAGGYGLLELREMARFFAGREWLPARVAAEADLVAAGATIHEEHCAECHEDAGRYQDKEIPRLAGQWPAYLLSQLLDYRTERVQMPQPDKMRNRLAKLSDADLAAVSAYYGQVDATKALAQDETANGDSH